MCPGLQYTDLTCMGGIGPCGPINIIFVVILEVSIQALIQNMVRIGRPQYTDLTYMGGTRYCGPIKIIVDNHI